MFRKIGDAMVDFDRLLVMQPRIGTNSNGIQLTFDTGETLVVYATDPVAAIESYLAAECITSARSSGAIYSTSVEAR
ncbi:MAG TPA: hypothetical protein VIT88_07960 [Pyrinomonadaceae bacterium]